MKFRIKKILAVALASAMAVGCFAGCSSSSSSGSAEPSKTESITKPAETVTLNVLSQISGIQGEQVGWMSKILLDKFNVKLNIVGDFDGTQLDQLKSSQGDIAVWGSKDDYENAIKENVLYDWNKDKLLDSHGSYIKNNLSKVLQEGEQLYGIGDNINISSSTVKNHFGSISSTTKYPELCMDIINWLYTPEGFLTTTYGPQGTCWDYDDEGYLYLTELGQKVREDRSVEMTGDYADSGSFSDGSLQVNSFTWDLSEVNPNSKQNETFDCSTWVKMQSDSQN